MPPEPVAEDEDTRQFEEDLKRLTPEGQIQARRRRKAIERCVMAAVNYGDKRRSEMTINQEYLVETCQKGGFWVVQD